MHSETFIDHLHADKDQIVQDLLLDVFGESTPDGLGLLGHETVHSFTKERKS